MKQQISKNGNPYTNFGIDGNFVSVDFEGNVIERTEQEYPYSFSQNCTWAILGKKREDIDKNKKRGGFYSDHMYQQDYLKYNLACELVWGNKGQYFDSRSPREIEKMLQLYTENPNIRLYRIVKQCNVSTGYPVWFFGYYE